MADGVTIKIKGIRTVMKKLSRLRAAVNEETADEMDGRVKDIEADVKRIIPRKTADLQRTAASEVERRAVQGPIGLVGVNKVYAKPLEDPSKGIKHRSRKGFIGKPTPFLIPALTKNLTKILSGLKKALKKAIQGVKG